MVFSPGEPKFPTKTLFEKTTHLMQDGMNARAFGELQATFPLQILSLQHGLWQKLERFPRISIT